MPFDSCLLPCFEDSLDALQVVTQLHAQGWSQQRSQRLSTSARSGPNLQLHFGTVPFTQGDEAHRPLMGHRAILLRDPADLLARGVSVSLGADGAPCNNRLDMFTEMRTSALIQKALLGPRTLPALTVLRMATTGGAKALGLDGEIGSIETGKRADLILLAMEKAHTTPHPDPVSAVVYSATASNVETVIIDGRAVMRDGKLLTLDEQEVLISAREHAELLNQKPEAGSRKPE